MRIYFVNLSTLIDGERSIRTRTDRTTLTHKRHVQTWYGHFNSTNYQIVITDIKIFIIVSNYYNLYQNQNQIYTNY